MSQHAAPGARPQRGPEDLHSRDTFGPGPHCRYHPAREPRTSHPDAPPQGAAPGADSTGNEAGHRPTPISHSLVTSTSASESREGYPSHFEPGLSESLRPPMALTWSKSLCPNLSYFVALETSIKRILLHLVHTPVSSRSRPA
jgi:hypothetical protein